MLTIFCSSFPLFLTTSHQLDNTFWSKTQNDYSHNLIILAPGCLFWSIHSGAREIVKHKTYHATSFKIVPWLSVSYRINSASLTLLSKASLSDQTFCYLPAASTHSVLQTKHCHIHSFFNTPHVHFLSQCLGIQTSCKPAKLFFKYLHDQLHYFIQLFQSTASLDYFHISYSCFAFMPQWESEVVMTETVWPINF